VGASSGREHVARHLDRRTVVEGAHDDRDIFHPPHYFCCRIEGITRAKATRCATHLESFLYGPQNAKGAFTSRTNDERSCTHEWTFPTNFAS
jgi:hypothetical protein